MTSIIGPNAAIRYLKTYQAHVKYWHEVNPVSALAYVDKPEHIPYILEYAAELPNTMIVARIKHDLDGGFHLAPTGKDDNRYYVSSPIEYHTAYGHLGRVDNIVLNVMNEPAGDADDATINRLVHWMVDYISVAARDKTKSVLFNWADRNPRINIGMMDERFDIVLQLMAAHPELFFMGLHFYGPDNITAHIDSYVARCDRLGIKPPRVIGTEFGIDSIGGTKRGFKTWPEYRDVYGQWQVGQVKESNDPNVKTLYPHIKSGTLYALNSFQEGNSGGWDDFDTENEKAYKDEIKRAALAGELEPMPKPVTKPFLTPVPMPSDAASALRIRVTNTLGINLRSGPSTDYQTAGSLANGQEVTLYQVPFKQASNGQVWRWVSVNDTLGGWCCTDVLTYEVVVIATPPVAIPPPVIIDTPPEVPPDPVIRSPYFEITGEYAAQLATYYAGLADVWRKIAEGTKLSNAA